MMKNAWSDIVNECKPESDHHVKVNENKYCDTGMNEIIVKMTRSDL